MKKTFFGSLGEMIKGNAVMIILGICVIAAGALSFYTVNDINNKLEQQNIKNPNSYSESIPEDAAQEVEQKAENVPLKDKTESTVPRTDKSDSKSDTEETAAESTSETVTDSAASGFILPVNGKVFAAFSGDELVYNKTMDDWRTHNGIDIRASKDNAVKACADGVVTNVYTDGMLGVVAEIDSGSFVVRYCGLGENMLCTKGKQVKQGDVIGVVGDIPLENAEDSHIHLEVLKNGVHCDPYEYING